MRPLAGLLLCAASVQAAPPLPATPLQPVYRALFEGSPQLAWAALEDAWPQLPGEAARKAWAEALAALVERQCGRDLALAPPAWAGELRVALIQRDEPLRRYYRAALNVRQAAAGLRVTLTDPFGRVLLNAQPLEEGQAESTDLDAPLPAGVYRLQLAAGGRSWSTRLALPRLADLAWLRRDGGHWQAQPAPSRAFCPPAHLVQAAYHQPDFRLLWWSRVDGPSAPAWPRRADAASVWASLSAVRRELRGAVEVELQHRVSGPYVQF